jgi:hypothetical protein
MSMSMSCQYSCSVNIVCTWTWTLTQTRTHTDSIVHGHGQGHGHAHDMHTGNILLNISRPRHLIGRLGCHTSDIGKIFKYNILYFIVRDYTNLPTYFLSGQGFIKMESHLSNIHHTKLLSLYIQTLGGLFTLFFVF